MPNRPLTSKKEHEKLRHAQKAPMVYNLAAYETDDDVPVRPYADPLSNPQSRRIAVHVS